jgi:hypothetical protein
VTYDDAHVYRFEIVGGPYDGTPGLGWKSDEEHVPQAIYVGICRGCEFPVPRGRHRHVAYWVEGDPARPPSTVVYSLERAWVEEDDDGERAIARYVFGSIEPRGDELAAFAGAPAGATLRYVLVTCTVAAVRVAGDHAARGAGRASLDRCLAASSA